MPAVRPVLERGPATYTVSSAVTGGQLVMPDTGTPGTIKTATAGATTVLGVAADDANTAAAAAAAPLNFASVRPEVAVYGGPEEVVVTAAAAVAFGQKVQAAANGQVTPYVNTNSADWIIGRCTDPNGIASAGKGRIKLF